ncbi:MAG: tetratricopeptide repeat protein [Candidatus Kerfeldbacteria bacterium]|nr:tetratricopeptide repeat protein [Candidatus Kerfeldbacteria bacterium]
MPPRRTPVAPRRRSSISPATTPGLRWVHFSQFSVCLTLLMLPLMVGGWTADSWETHKLLLLLLGVSFAWLGFLLAKLQGYPLPWTWHLLDWPVLGLVAVAIIGLIVSVQPWHGIVGLNGTLAGTVPATIGMVSLYFLVSRLFRSQHEHTIVWSSLLGGAGISLLLQLFQFSGVSLLPAPFHVSRLFSTLANSPVQDGIIAAAVVTAAMLLWTMAKERWLQLALAALVTLGWLVLLFFGQAVSWSVFALGMIVVVWYQAVRERHPRTGVMAVAILLAAAGMVAQLTHVNRWADLPTPTEVNISQTATWQTTWNTLKVRPVLGSGPETWYQDFIEHRPVSFNQDTYWSSRFIRAGNAWAQQLATTGLAGAGMWIAVMFFAWWMLRPSQQHGSTFSSTMAQFLILATALTGLFATWSFVLLAMLWVGLGLARSTVQPATEAKTVNRGPLPTLAFTILVMVLVGFWYSAIRVYASQIVLQRAQNDITATKSLASVEATLQTALRLDSRNIDAGVLLANAYAVEAQLADTAGETTKVQSLISQSLNAMDRVIRADRNNPAVYEASNNLVNNLASYVSDAVTIANNNFKTLQRLEPASPIHDVGYGQTLMLLRSQVLAQAAEGSAATAATYYQQAQAAYRTALNKKADYLQAQYALAQAHIAAGDYDQALVQLDDLLRKSPQVALFWSSVGVTRAKQQKLDEAKTFFEHALTLDNQDATIYSDYATAYSEADQKDVAKEILNRGLEAIPENVTLKAQLAELTA